MRSYSANRGPTASLLQEAVSDRLVTSPKPWNGESLNNWSFDNLMSRVSITLRTDRCSEALNSQESLLNPFLMPVVVSERLG